MAATPAADVKDLPNAYQFIIDMPGLKSGDIKVSIEDDNVLVVTGERKQEDEKEGVQYVRMERRVGEFMREFVLPDNAKIDALSAVCRDGVLTVTLEKLPPLQPKNRNTIEDKMPRKKRYGEAQLDAHHPTHLNPVIPAPISLVAPQGIFENDALPDPDLSQQQQWYQEWDQEQPPEVNWYVKMRNVDAPSFDGMQDPSTAEKWIRKMETLCRAMGVPNEKQVSVAVPFLTELAEEWYETVKGTYGVLDWATFKQLFNKNYIPAWYRVQKQREFYSLSQEGMTVREYANEFIGLLRYVPAILTDEECMVECFKSGLDYNIGCKLCGERFGSYQAVYDAALRVEGWQKSMKRRRNSP